MASMQCPDISTGCQSGMSSSPDWQGVSAAC